MHHYMKTLAVLLLAMAAAACARAYPPPGGDRDTLPPGLVNTTPEPLAVVPNFRGPVVFRFDEGLSERNFSEAMVTVSPQDGAMRLRRAGNEIRVEIDGGWRPDRVYRVVVLPGLRDRHGNARDQPAEVVFSTGPPIPETAVAGIVMDRLTNRPVQSAVVRAVRRGAEESYVAVGDAEGFFSLRHLPLGVYDVQAFADVNRNRRLDPAEPVAARQLSLAAEADTVTMVFSVLAPDTTPPRVTRAEMIDSLHVRLTFDDSFDPEQPQTTGSAVLHALPDSVLHARSNRLLVGSVWERERRTAAAVRPAPDVPSPDTLAVPPTPPAEPPRPPQAQPGRPAGAEQPLLPTRELVLVLEAPLRPGTYMITVAGVVNIHGLTGGGVVRLQVAEPPSR
jgi:hypothetical protein